MTIPVQDSPSQPVDPKVLAALGIILFAPRGEVIYRDGWAVIGAVIVTGAGVAMAPRSGLSGEQWARLGAAAFQVWLFGRCALRGWRYRSRRGWATGVGMFQPFEDVSLMGRSSISASVSSIPMMLAGSSVPSAL